jgi:hypothetical protein
LRSVRATPLHTAVLLTPGYAASNAVRRGLELGLEVSYRTVRLRPLFPDVDGPDPVASSVVVEVILHSGAEPISASLLNALARYPLAAVFRTIGDDLLIQHRLAAPLPDQQLAALADGGNWVIADAAFGCWLREPLGEPSPGTGLVKVDDGYELVSQSPLSPDEAPAATEIRLVPARLPRQRVDATLLDDADLPNIALLLEHHPLADIAVIVPGRDRHLLLAAGGTLEDLGVGEPLACVGPGPLYVPVGRRLSPRLPGSARRALFTPDEHHAIVILDRQALRFEIDRRRPVWTLWSGLGPEVDTQLPGRSRGVLAELAQREPAVAAPAAATPPRWWSRSRPAAVPATSWRDEAFAAEQAGDLVRSAELHRRNQEPLRAAHLFERAAQELSRGQQ